MTTSESKGRFFLLNESIRIDSHNESNRIDSNRELECSSRHYALEWTENNETYSPNAVFLLYSIPKTKQCHAFVTVDQYNILSVYATYCTRYLKVSKLRSQQNKNINTIEQITKHR